MDVWTEIQTLCIKKTRQERKLWNSDKQLQISSEGDYDCHNFNFAPKFPQIGVFQPQMWHFWAQIFENFCRFSMTIFQQPRHNGTKIDKRIFK